MNWRRCCHFVIVGNVSKRPGSVSSLTRPRTKGVKRCLTFVLSGGILASRLPGATLDVDTWAPDFPLLWQEQHHPETVRSGRGSGAPCDAERKWRTQERGEGRGSGGSELMTTDATRTGTSGVQASSKPGFPTYQVGNVHLGSRCRGESSVPAGRSENPTGFRPSTDWVTTLLELDQI